MVYSVFVCITLSCATWRLTCARRLLLRHRSRSLRPPLSLGRPLGEHLRLQDLELSALLRLTDSTGGRTPRYLNTSTLSNLLLIFHTETQKILSRALPTDWSRSFLPSAPSSCRPPGTWLSSSFLSGRDRTPAEPSTLTHRMTECCQRRVCL